jgi:hypothetical protein
MICDGAPYQMAPHLAVGEWHCHWQSPGSGWRALGRPRPSNREGGPSDELVEVVGLVKRRDPRMAPWTGERREDCGIPGGVSRANGSTTAGASIG